VAARTTGSHAVRSINVRKHTQLKVLQSFRLTLITDVPLDRVMASETTRLAFINQRVTRIRQDIDLDVESEVENRPLVAH